MQSINVNIVGKANMTGATGQMERFAAATTSANAALSQMVNLQNGMDAKGYREMRHATQAHAAYFRDAMASTGMFEVQQVRLNKATDEYIKNLDKQRLSFKKLRQQRNVAAAALQEQLALQNMMIRENVGNTAGGKTTYDTFMPKTVGRSHQAAQMKLAMLSAELKSGATQMINWGKNTQWAGRQLMVGFTIPVAAAGAAMGVLAYSIDKELTRIAKVYDTYADASTGRAEDIKAAEEELAELREQGVATATKAAKEYGAAARDTLDVQAELAAVGQRGADLQESTNQVMRIATLGEIDRTVATKAQIAMQSTLNATVEETANMFNFMNSVENATSLAMSDFATAIPRALGPMREMSEEGASAMEVFQNLSVLMVAMKERGIEAGEGANAVKALMSRLYRPSKQVSSEWVAMGLGDPRKFAEEGKDIMEILAMVNERVSGLKGNQRTQALAGLFGTYQVARMNAMLKGLEGVNKEGSQTARVFESIGESASTHADRADQEIKKMAESLSGRWNRALESMKIAASEIGRPFLALATHVVSAIGWILEKFNELPSGLKMLTGLGIGLSAIAGPIIMLTGLFGNLVGQAIKGIGVLTGLATKLKIVNKETAMNDAAAAMVTEGFTKEMTATQQLKAELEAMARAMRMATVEHNNMIAELSEKPISGVPLKGHKDATNAYYSKIAADKKNRFYVDEEGKSRPKTTAMMQRQAEEKLGDELMYIQGFSQQGTKEAYEERKKLADETIGKEIALENKKRQRIDASAAATTALGAAMTLSMVSSNEAVDKVSQLAMVAMGVVPVVGLLRQGWDATGGRIMAARKEAQASGKSVKTLSSRVSGLVTRARMLPASFAATLGPLGLMAAAIAVIGTGIFMWFRHAEKTRKEQQKAVYNANNAANNWAKSVGKVKKEYKDVTGAINDGIAAQRKASLWEEYTSGGMKGTTKAIKRVRKEDGDKGLLVAAGKQFAELRVEYGLTAKEAEEHVRVLLQASGAGLYEVDRITEEILKNYSLVTSADIGKYLQAEIDALNSLEFGSDKWKQAGKDVGEAYMTAMKAAVHPDERRRLTEQFFAEASRGYNATFEAMTNNKAWADRFKQLGITGQKEMQKAIAAEGGIKQFVDRAFGEDSGHYDLTAYTELIRMLEQAKLKEDALFDDVAKSVDIGKLFDDGIPMVEAFFDTLSFEMLNLGKLDGLEKLKSEITDLTTDPFTGKGFDMSLFTEEPTIALENFKNALGDLPLEKAKDVATAIDSYAKTHGFKIGANEAETFRNILLGVRAAAKSAEGAVRSASNAFTMVNPKTAMDTLKDASAAATAEIADGIADEFDSGMQASLDSKQRYWDGRKDALSASIDRQQDALDAKWEKKKDAAEKYWDRREKAVESAIDAEQEAEEKRQRMFEAEIARIEKLNDLANNTIDFNVELNAGNLDEAAKIRNNIGAENVRYALEQAADASGRRSESRVGALEDRQDSIGEARDRAMDALDKREKAEKKHLDNISKARERALDRDSQRDIEYHKKNWDRRKKTFDRELRILREATLTSEADAKAHLKRMGVKYSVFGKTIEGKADKWARHFKNVQIREVNAAAEIIRTSKAWEDIGRDSAEKLVQGFGFTSWSQFRRFLATGEMTPDKKKKRGTASKGNPPRAGDSRTSNRPGRGGVPMHHSGGWVGSSQSSRSGVARTNPIHPNEQMVLAQKKEFIVNRQASQKHGPLLEAINSGANLDSPQNKGPKGAKGGNVTGGLAGLMTGSMVNALSYGISRAATIAYDKAKAIRESSMAGGTYGAGKAGTYGDRAFSMEQLKNAAIIASVGSKMGMSSRDIQIGIMTAITESGLVNVKYGDRDSQGLFQQRPSMGWGTVAQVTDPQYASRKFFEALKGHKERNDEVPWLAAQHVQRSAFADGSNYRQYWDEAQAIFKSGLKRSKNGGYGVGAGFVEGTSKGWHPASTRGKGWSNSHDYRNGPGSPLYAVHAGRIIESRAVTSGGSPGNGKYATPYRSYGETIVLNTPGGNLRYAHLNPGQRYVSAGQYVRAGALIGRSGNTGNSTGPHTHFDINGNYNASGWMARHGISLRKGAEDIRFDNTVANLHKGEAVLTKDISTKFREGVDNFASGGNNNYTVEVNVATDASPDEIANKVMSKLQRLESRKPRSRKS